MQGGKGASLDMVVDESELAKRSVITFGEIAAALGEGQYGSEVVIRWQNALGARMQPDIKNPWFNAAVVPPGVVPPVEDPRLPLCVWTLGDAVPGRVEDPDLATPCLGLDLQELKLPDALYSTVDMQTPPLEVLGELNERAYGDPGGFVPLAAKLRDKRVRSHGLLEDGVFVCVALTIEVGDDLGVHFVATEESFRRRGLASRLVSGLMASAREKGMRTASLQASKDGLPVWKKLGFRHVGTLRGYVRPSPT